MIVIVIIVNRKDKYTKPKYNQVYNKDYKKDYKKEKKIDKDYFFICDTLAPPELNLIKNDKLGAVSKNKFVFQPKIIGGIKQYDPLRIFFMEEPTTLEKTYSSSKIKQDSGPLRMREIDGVEYLTLDDSYLPPEYEDADGQGYIILDPLEKDYLDYKITDLDYASKMKNAIKQIVKERWKPFINMELIFIEDDPELNWLDKQQQRYLSDIRITFNPNSGNNSRVGSDCQNVPKDKNTINFAWFDVKTIIHEFGHALGLIHEHQTPLEGAIAGYEWDLAGLYKFYEPQMKSRGIDPADPSYKSQTNSLIVTNVLGTCKEPCVKGDEDCCGFNGTIFDKDSIMLYAFPKSCFNMSSRFFIKGLKKNPILSINDVGWISYLYPEFDEKNDPVKFNIEKVCLKYQDMYKFKRGKVDECPV